MSKGKPTRAPEVGIIYLVGKKLWIYSTPVARAMNFGGNLIHKRDHQRYWEQLVKRGDGPDTGDDRYPRGRVSYNGGSGKFTLLADRCILGKKSLVSKILSRMNLPVGGTKLDRDSHYRCYRCLGRNR
ncbi:MAG TPA: hypothetical protein VN875_09035 [Candidatus Binatus sp.]|nr:hypothetical protein [Candidatus Binatus sp.]